MEISAGTKLQRSLLDTIAHMRSVTYRYTICQRHLLNGLYRAIAAGSPSFRARAEPLTERYDPPPARI